MKQPSLAISLIPVVLLIGMLSGSIVIFGDEMLSGPSQIVLVFTTAVIIAISRIGYKTSWEQFENCMITNIANCFPSILILFMMGAICSAWMHSGIIPTMIYYGLEVISVKWFLVTACIISSLVSLCIGSSWTTIATIGVGLMAIGQTLGLHHGWVAGAIISGAYFGDKMSPLSETTNLASTMAGVKLFDHIRNMLRTTVPSIAITLLIFMFAGLLNDNNAVMQMESVEQTQQELKQVFCISPWLLLVPAGLFYLLKRGVTAVVVLFFGALVAAVIMPIFNPGVVEYIVGHHLTGFKDCFESSMRVVGCSVSYDTGSSVINELVSTNGMGGLLNTIWLIICSMCFGGAMEASGMLGKITDSLLIMMKGRFATVVTTSASSLFVNLTTGDQSLAIILPAKMYGEAYSKQQLKPSLLSRTVEDSGTVTSVLIPWNSCGMAQSTVLGVATVAYAPYCFFCWISPIMTMIFALLHDKVKKIMKLNK